MPGPVRIGASHNRRPLFRRAAPAAAVVVAFLWFDAASTALAQASDRRGAISGVVVASDGARLPGVVINVASAGSVVGQVVSDDHGGYRVSRLRAGLYEVQGELEGFETITLSAHVVPGRVTTVDLTLQLRSLKESITVVALSPRHTIEAPIIAESGARDVGEALGEMAGVWKVRRGAIASDVVLRGYQGDNVTVLIDGVRLYGACPNNMDHTAFHVDFAEVDRIEVGKGPFDVKNQGGLGGVVNIITKRPGRGLHATPRVALGSYGYVNPSGTASFGATRVAVLGGYSFRMSNSYRDGSGRSFLAAANYGALARDVHAFEVDTEWGRVDLVPADHHVVMLTATHQHAGTVVYPYLQMDALDDTADRAKAGWDVTPHKGPVQALKTEAYVTRVRHWMTDQYRVSAVSAPREYSMATLARTATAGLRTEAVLTDLTLGIEAYRREWSTETQFAAMAYRPQHSIPDAGITFAGVFGQYSRRIDESLRVDAGMRIDRSASAADAGKADVALYRTYHDTASTSANDVHAQGNLRASWQARAGLTISGGVGRTVRVPDPQERYFALRRAGTDWVGNPGLRPTSNTAANVAMDVRYPRLSLAASAHHDALGDFIAVYQQARVTAVPGVANSRARSYRNVGATISGAELEGVVTLTDRLFLVGEASFVRGRQQHDRTRGIPGANLAEIPPHRSRLALRYDSRHDRHGVFAVAEAVYSSRQTRVDTTVGETPTPAYFIANIRTGGVVGPLRVSIGVNNLFDRTYVEHLSYQRDPFRLGVRVYEPGRNVYTNVALTF